MHLKSSQDPPDVEDSRHSIDVEFATTFSPLPSETDVIRWCIAALPTDRSCAVSIRIVDPLEIQQLNRQFRHKDKPTNVLSFPFEKDDFLGADFLEEDLLGDIAICAPIVDSEARAQHKTYEANFAHMVVHGTLHLQGYDHVEAKDADVMEGLEIKILQTLGFADPYKESHE